MKRTKAHDALAKVAQWEAIVETICARKKAESMDAIAGLDEDGALAVLVGLRRSAGGTENVDDEILDALIERCPRLGGNDEG